MPPSSVSLHFIAHVGDTRQKHKLRTSESDVPADKPRESKAACFEQFDYFHWFARLIRVTTDPVHNIVPAIHASPVLMVCPRLDITERLESQHCAHECLKLSRSNDDERVRNSQDSWEPVVLLLDP